MTHFRVVIEWENGSRQFEYAGEHPLDGKGLLHHICNEPVTSPEVTWAVNLERSPHGDMFDHRWTLVDQHRLPDLPAPDDDPGSMTDGRWGWCPPAQQRLLADLASSAPEGVVVELGAWKGLSARALRRGAKPVISVDTFRLPLRPAHALDVGEHFGRLNGDDDGIRAVRKLTHLAVGEVAEPVALLYLDADHSYEGTHRDLAAWAPKLAEGALLVFDDVMRASFPGVYRLMADFEEQDVLTLLDEQEGQVTWRVPPGVTFTPPTRRRFPAL